jgi:acetoin utilization deacetylase AcuC-like enzyme
MKDRRHRRPSSGLRFFRFPSGYHRRVQPNSIRSSPGSAESLKLWTFSSAAYLAPLPAGHVFPMSKFAETARAVAEFAEVIDPGPVADRDLLRVHTADYVRSIRTGEYNETTRLKLGLPWSPELSRRSHYATQGTLRAARQAFSAGLAANLAGGTHHAFPDSGQGFCVFNDVAVAARALLADDGLYQLMVVDLDAHQGNGTNHIFRDDPRVYTYSVHVGRNYPSAKVPGSEDVELPRFAPPDMFFEKLESTLPRAVEAFEPDLAFYIAGVDVHVDDRFGQMCLSTADMAQRDRWTIELLRGWGIPTVVVYGGGYNKTPGMTAKLHVQTVRIAADRLAAEQSAKRGDYLLSL